MFQLVRITLIFLLGYATTKLIEDSPLGAFLMGSASLALCVWTIIDITNFVRAIAPWQRA